MEEVAGGGGGGGGEECNKHAHRVLPHTLTQKWPHAARTLCLDDWLRTTFPAVQADIDGASVARCCLAAGTTSHSRNQVAEHSSAQSLPAVLSAQDGGMPSERRARSLTRARGRHITRPTPVL